MHRRSVVTASSPRKPRAKRSCCACVRPGAGMSDQEIKAALQPFRQMATASRWGTSGTGLGLPDHQSTWSGATRRQLRPHRHSAVQDGTLVEIAFPVHGPGSAERPASPAAAGFRREQFPARLPRVGWSEARRAAPPRLRLVGGRAGGSPCPSRPAPPSRSICCFPRPPTSRAASTLPEVRYLQREGYATALSVSVRLNAIKSGPREPHRRPTFVESLGFSLSVGGRWMII